MLAFTICKLIQKYLLSTSLPGISTTVYKHTKSFLLSYVFISYFSIFNLGQTYYGGESLSISENPDNIFRILLKFGGINTIIPNGAFISSARLTLSFANWATATTVQACFMTRPWDQAQPLQRYQLVLCISHQLK